MSPEFVPALELNAGFYREVVEPLVRAWPHSAAHLGYGSDVLGYDDARSTDHGWGPRLAVFVEPSDVRAARDAVNEGLPETFGEWPVWFDRNGTADTHQVIVAPLADWLTGWLGCNPLAGLSTIEWLTTPQQLILGVVRGAVYHDASGSLSETRERLRYFPDELTLWMIACQWRRIEQEEHFVGRTAEIGDEIGSRVLAARIVRELMRLHFLLERRYWPYSKWFVTEYRTLPRAEELLPIYEAAVDAPDYAHREDALVAAYEMVAHMHNDAGLTEPVEPTVRPFFTRPFRTLASDRFVAACVRSLHDDWLRALPLVGSIDQFADSTDVLQYPNVARRLRAIYGDAP